MIRRLVITGHTEICTRQCVRNEIVKHNYVRCGSVYDTNVIMWRIFYGVPLSIWSGKKSSQKFRKHILLLSSGRLNCVHMDPSSFPTALIYNVSSIFPNNRHISFFPNTSASTWNRCSHTAEPRKKTSLLSTAMKNCKLIFMEESDSILAVRSRAFYFRCAPLWVYPNTTDDLSFRIAQVEIHMDWCRSWRYSRVVKDPVRSWPGRGFSMARASFICGERYRVTPKRFVSNL